MQTEKLKSCLAAESVKPDYFDASGVSVAHGSQASLLKGATMRKIPNLSGAKFGRLTVVDFSFVKNKKSYWRCLCVCGNKKIIAAKNLRAGHTKSCGCLHAEGGLSNGGALSKTHWHSTRIGKVGQYRSKTYICWMGMKFRCLNPNHKYFHHYGGRGIEICERWMKFENFLADMGERPDGMTIERKDNNGNYEPSNCKWAGNIEQGNNRRNNRVLVFNGVSKTVTQWSVVTGIKMTTLKERIVRGWSVERALGYV